MLREEIIHKITEQGEEIESCKTQIGWKEDEIETAEEKIEELQEMLKEFDKSQTKLDAVEKEGEQNA